jgi:hypothetical protein
MVFCQGQASPPEVNSELPPPPPTEGAFGAGRMPTPRGTGITAVQGSIEEKFQTPPPEGE